MTEPTQHEQQLQQAYEHEQAGGETLTVQIEVSVQVSEGGMNVIQAMEACKPIIEGCRKLGPTRADLKLGRKWLPLA